MKKITKKDAIEALWRKAILHWKLDNRNYKIRSYIPSKNYRHPLELTPIPIDNMT